MKHIGGLVNLHFLAVDIDFGAVTQEQKPGLTETNITLECNLTIILIDAGGITAYLAITLRNLYITL